MTNVKTINCAAALSILLITTAGCGTPPTHEPSAPMLEKIINTNVSNSSGRLVEKYETKLFELNASLEKLKKKNARLTSEISDLNRTNARCKMLLELQDKVLQLLDDKNNTVRTMLTEEATKLNLPVKFPEGERTYFNFMESDLFDPGDVRINAKGKKLLSELCRDLESNNLKSIIIENNPCEPGIKSGTPDLRSPECSFSTARAAAVVEFLSRGMNLQDRQISFGTFISLKPDPLNARFGDPERRIDIVLELTH